MKFFALLLVCIHVLEIPALLTYFVVYFIDYAYCSSATDYEHLYELIFTLFVTSGLAAISNFLFFFKTVFHSVKMFHRHLAMADDSTRPYHGAYVCYHLFFISGTLTSALLFAMMSTLCLSVYVCPEEVAGGFCAIDPHLIFDDFGYHASVALALLSALFLPITVVKLRPLC